jgi:hypothetical protein
MSTFERRQQFEALCQLRALYRLRGDWDATSTISIDEVVAYAVRLLEEPDALAVALGIDESSDTAAQSRDSKR